jgi:hypothetical protein
MMEQTWIFIVNIQTERNRFWFRTFDSGWITWDEAHNRVRSIIAHFGGDFPNEQIVTARNGSYHWSWWENKTGDGRRVIEIQKIDLGRIYDWDDWQPQNPHVEGHPVETLISDIEPIEVVKPAQKKTTTKSRRGKRNKR